MDKGILREILLENQRMIPQIKLVRRDFTFERNGNYVLTGVRQAGKSFLLYQRILQILEEGHSIEEIAFINFDDERLFKMEVSELNSIIEAYRSLFSHTPILFFDEIQNIEGWEHFARRLANEKYRVYITGSNAKMLSREVATVLGGRYFTNMVFPYSFEEYLRASDIELKKHWQYGKTADEINRIFAEYFIYGGFPEILKYQDKRGWLNTLFDRIYFSDMVVRNNVRNEEGLRMTVKRLAENVKQPVSYGRISNLIKATGLSSSPASVLDYVKFMRESCMIFSIENYRSKFVEKETVKKHYFVDNGLLNIFLLNAETSLLENICAIHLYRKFEKDLYYFKMNEEVDFYIPSQGLGIQVAYSLRESSVIEREVKGLKLLHEKYPLNKMLIITRDEKDEIVLNDEIKIEVIPVWQWLLEE
ncbi:MAG: ATP-binding protein [Muribaculaceae bacterium]|nr:ATP-binding protein [Muribaculaceae bacterium]